jgi:tetratricopeptide (TPR) repeat protein
MLVRLEQIEKTLADAKKTISADEDIIKKEDDNFKSNVDRYMEVANAVVSWEAAVFVVLTIILMIVSWFAQRDTLSKANAQIAAMERLVNDKIRKFEDDFGEHLKAAKKAAEDAEAHSTAAHRQLEEASDATKEVIRLKEQMAGSSQTTVERAGINRLDLAPAPPSRGIEEATEFLSKYGANTEFDSQYNTGIIAYSNGDYDAALAAFQAAILKAPDDMATAKALYSSAVTFLSKKAPDSENQASYALDKIMALQDKLLPGSASLPILARTQVRRAGILRAREDYSGATSVYTWITDRLADRTDRDMRALFGMALVQRGITWIDRKEYPRAIDDFVTLLKRFPNSDDPELRGLIILAHYNLARALTIIDKKSCALGAYNDAIRLLEGATDQKSQDILGEALLGAAGVHDQLGETAAAAEYRDRASRLG